MLNPGEETPPLLKENKMANTEVVIDEKIKIRATEPKRWKVILLNDDSTPMDFVMAVLMEIFKHTTETAHDIMLQVHETGSGIAGIYSFEIAEAKAVEATNLARTNGHPLQIKLEEE
jgi:ATP-dependent Clp protease adaptor protein ClpS